MKWWQLQRFKYSSTTSHCINIFSGIYLICKKDAVKGQVNVSPFPPSLPPFLLKEQTKLFKVTFCSRFVVWISKFPFFKYVCLLCTTPVETKGVKVIATATEQDQMQQQTKHCYFSSAISFYCSNSVLLENLNRLKKCFSHENVICVP